jgi:hypothetical protein
LSVSSCFRKASTSSASAALLPFPSDITLVGSLVCVTWLPEAEINRLLPLEPDRPQCALPALCAANKGAVLVKRRRCNASTRPKSIRAARSLMKTTMQVQSTAVVETVLHCRLTNTGWHAVGGLL